MKILAIIGTLAVVLGAGAWAGYGYLGDGKRATGQIAGNALSLSAAASEPQGQLERGLPGTLAPPDPLPEIPFEGQPSFMQRFDEPLTQPGWYLADFVYESATQRAGWSKDHIIEGPDGITLKITREPKEFQPYTGAELQRTGRYHYGRYEVVMKAAYGSGIVSSFFTHTDGFFGDPHNEIDFEFLGYDTEMVQLNFYSGNGNMQGHLVDLPYDAANEYQLYAFEWMPDHIDWYIGDQHVLRATEASTGLRIPYRPSRLMMNVWSGSERQYDWHGEPTFESGASAQYLCASYLAPGDRESGQCSDWFVPDVPRLGE